MGNIGGLRVAVAVFLLVAAIAASVGGFRAGREDTNRENYFGAVDNPNRVDVNAWITEVDSASQTLSMTIQYLRPRGLLADANGNFASDVTLTATAIGDWRFSVEAGDAVPDYVVQVAVFGNVTDYPFDSYSTVFELHITDAEGRELPTAVTVVDKESFFSIDTTDGLAQDGGTAINLLIRRSASTLVFAISIMVLMLGLAAAAATAAFYVLHGNRGLVFPACSLMAAMLFALIPLRNAVPGNPPVGSLIDFGSFFIAEAIIAVSLISCVIVGFRQQQRIDNAGAGG